MEKAANLRIRSMDMPIIDRVFDMESGVVLNFSNRTFEDFFREELGVDIYDRRWAAQGESKAKRLRYYLRHADRQASLATLETLWEYRETTGVTERYSALDDAVRTAFFSIIERLGGTPPGPAQYSAETPGSQIDEALASSLEDHLLSLSQMEPQPRGYAFEKFLKRLFEAHGLAPHAPFRLVGEQIDGSFVLQDDTYLLEAKWTNSPINAATLRSFNAKVEDKAKWSRGLLVSNSGFSLPGLTAFGRGKSVICMDGLDLYDVLSRRLDFVRVLSLKARHAAETGEPFARVRDLNVLTAR